MSENDRRYPQKMAELKAARGVAPHPLRAQVDELLMTVSSCERIWSVEDRIERSLDTPGRSARMDARRLRDRW
jgi:hypothetical protein